MKEQVKSCTECGEEKTLSEFVKDRRMKDGCRNQCRACKREQANETARRYRDRHPGRSAENTRRWREANPERARAAARESVSRWRSANPDRHQEMQADYRSRLRAEVFSHYGESCTCCGDSSDPVIDHVDGTGAEHRAELFNGRQDAGWHFYPWLVREGFPEGFQTLCRPCNVSKGKGTRCMLNHPESQKGAVA